MNALRAARTFIASIPSTQTKLHRPAHANAYRLAFLDGGRESKPSRRGDGCLVEAVPDGPRNARALDLTKPRDDKLHGHVSFDPIGASGRGVGRRLAVRKAGGAIDGALGEDGIGVVRGVGRRKGNRRP